MNGWNSTSASDRERQDSLLPPTNHNHQHHTPDNPSIAPNSTGKPFFVMFNEDHHKTDNHQLLPALRSVVSTESVSSIGAIHKNTTSVLARGKPRNRTQSAQMSKLSSTGLQRTIQHKCGHNDVRWKEVRQLSTVRDKTQTSQHTSDFQNASRPAGEGKAMHNYAIKGHHSANLHHPP